MRLLSAGGIFLMLSLAAVPRANAQSLFVDGSLFYGIDARAHSVTDPTSPTLDLSGAALGGGVGVGTWLTPSVTVRLELSIPKTRTESQETTTSLIPVDMTRPPLGLPYPTVTVTNRIDASEQLSTASALVGYHTQRRHGIQLGYLGGASFAVIEQRARYSTSYSGVVLLPDLTQYGRSNEVASTGYGVTAEVGLDADVEVGRHFSLVPRARMFAFNGGLTVRVGVSARARW